jgi:hypothetical protein
VPYRRYNPDRHDLGAEDIARLLAPHALALARELLPNGKRYGHLWRIGSLAGEPGQSLALHLDGPQAGEWVDYNGVGKDRSGDLLDVIAAVHTHGHNIGGAMGWARRWLGLSSERLPRDEVAKVKAAAAAKQERDDAEAARKAAERRERAKHIWEKARPLVPGDPVDRYLKSRAIDLGVLGRAPAALRYAPRLTYEPGQRFPAMVAAITDAAVNFRAIHRTFLEIDALGRVTKAPVDEPKKSLGPIAGGSIKLWRPQGDVPWIHMPIGSTIVGSEGIEDGLAAIIGAEIAFPSRLPGPPVPVRNLRVIAVVSLANLALLELLPQASRLVFLEQRDPPGSKAEKALKHAIEQLQSVGIEVLLLRMPAWSGVKDMADMLRRVV